MSEVRIAKGRMLVSSPRLKTGLDDIVHGLTRWGSWWVLAVNDRAILAHHQYGGDRTGLVFAAIFVQSSSDYLPFLGAGLIMWGLLSSRIVQHRSFRQRSSCAPIQGHAQWCCTGPFCAIC